MQLGISIPLLLGPRVSAKGGLNAPGNALLVDLTIDISRQRSEPSKTLIFVTRRYYDETYLTVV